MEDAGLSFGQKRRKSPRRPNFGRRGDDKGGLPYLVKSIRMKA